VSSDDHSRACNHERLLRRLNPRHTGTGTHEQACAKRKCHHGCATRGVAQAVRNDGCPADCERYRQEQELRLVRGEGADGLQRRPKNWRNDAVDGTGDGNHDAGAITTPDGSIHSGMLVMRGRWRDAIFNRWRACGDGWFAPLSRRAFCSDERAPRAGSARSVDTGDYLQSG
jgi:hypothetical protein